MTMPPIHVVPIERTATRDHSASKLCWCGAILIGRDLATTADVYRHRDPVVPRKPSPPPWPPEGGPVP